MKTMNCFYRFIWIMAAILCATQEMGAQVVVDAKLDSVNILIGEQVGMEVNVTAPKNARIVCNTTPHIIIAKPQAGILPSFYLSEQCVNLFFKIRF